jgi:probable phosphoglycerate mutase
MAKIYLIRHAESIANTQSIYQGQTYDTDLSELGQKQVRALTKHLQKLKINKIFTSPLKRTFQTAEELHKTLDKPLFTDQRIIETSHGQWEGKHKKVIMKTWPDLYKKWLKFPSIVKFPDGEHFLDTQKRVVDWWKSLRNVEGDILAVTHDNIIRILIAKVLNMKLNRIWKFHLQPTSITLIETTASFPKLVYLNDSKHLGDLQANLALHAL